jgi:nitrate/TMAO reductase-like tetraheme cytochrome c subunit
LLKPHVEQICFNCHNKATHSGVAEHLGRMHKGEEVTCLSCHVAHRAESKTWESPSGFSGGKSEVQPGSQFQVSSKKETMIRRTCSECHQWR